jgi:hypothetical protein
LHRWADERLDRGHGCRRRHGASGEQRRDHTAATIADNRGACTRGEEKSLGWVFLEIGLALAIAVAIVWWTLPSKPKSGDEKDEP